jgi:hypothetical protein
MDTGAETGDAEAARGEEPVRLTLQETAELHDISPSYLSRRVREGRPAKGHELSEHAVIESGRVEGFEFPPGYEFPAGGGETRQPEGGGAASSGQGGGKRVEGAGPDEKDNSAEEKTMADGAGLSPDGFAQTARQFHAGRGAWGRLQLVDKKSLDGESPKEGAEHLEFFPVENPATIDTVAETYGAGTYRLSRLSGGREIHITFEVSRMAPSEVERRLAKTDELEYRNDLLEKELVQAEEETQELRNKLDETEQELHNTKFELDEERFEREETERKLEWLREDFEQELEFEKDQLRWEKEEEVRKAKWDLEQEVDDLEMKIETMKWEHRREIQELKHEHEMEKIEIRNGREEKAIDQIGRLAGKLAEGIEENPDVTWGLFYRGLEAMGMKELADRVARNWRQAQQRRGGPEGDSQRKAANGQENGGENEGRRDGEAFRSSDPTSAERWKRALIGAVFEPQDLESPPSGADPQKEMKSRAPLRPSNFVHQTVCPGWGEVG